MDRRRIIGSLGAVAACAVLAPRAARGQDLISLRLGTAPVDVGALGYYALDEGMFKKAGLDVELVRAANGPAIAAAVASGTVDIGSGNALSIAQAHERGLPFVFVAPSGAYLSTIPTAGLVVAKNGPIKSPKDFAGATVGVNTLGALGEISMRAWLDKNGVDPKTVKFIEIPYSAMDAALVSGQIAGAAMEDPALDRTLAADGKFFAPVWDGIAKDFAEGGFFATADFVKAHPDAVRRFAAAIAEAARWANANQGASAKILEKYSGVPAADMVHRVHYEEKLDPATIQPLIDAAAKYGTLKASFPATDLIATGY